MEKLSAIEFVNKELNNNKVFKDSYICNLEGKVIML
jgi:hypothetical protein